MLQATLCTIFIFSLICVGDGSTYTIKSGDTCWALSNSRGISVQDVLDANPGIQCDSLQIGQKIRFGSGGSGSSGSRSSGGRNGGYAYTIKSGDTCWALSNSRGISVQDIQDANPGIQCDNLQIGQKIRFGSGSGNGNGGGGGNCQDSFNRVMLDMHNKYRRNHGARPLRLKTNLISFAKSWSSQLSRNNQWKHSSSKGMGENLAMSHGKDCGKLAKGMFMLWYNEKSLFDFQRGGFSKQTGHFTQVVWKSTTHVGCGISFKGDKAIGSCNYSPPGNYRGQYRANVSS